LLTGINCTLPSGHAEKKTLASNMKAIQISNKSAKLFENLLLKMTILNEFKKLQFFCHNILEHISVPNACIMYKKVSTLFSSCQPTALILQRFASRISNHCDGRPQLLCLTFVGLNTFSSFEHDCVWSPRGELTQPWPKVDRWVPHVLVDHQGVDGDRLKSISIPGVAKSRGFPHIRQKFESSM